MGGIELTVPAALFAERRQESAVRAELHYAGIASVCDVDIAGFVESYVEGGEISESG